ncbi:hypothetical protein BDZ89DRAFT_1049088 [Hymenopellis radicata]|nr:hypothetical protein BDZ89DRAFT_1049088 [Hymenopellis radicata]
MTSTSRRNSSYSISASCLLETAPLPVKVVVTGAIGSAAQARVLNGDATATAIVEEFQSLKTNNAIEKDNAAITIFYAGHGAASPIPNYSSSPDAYPCALSDYHDGLELIWGVLTGSTQWTFLGLCESSAWPGMMTLFVHWYTPTELAKRMGFYHSCQAFGRMMANALQTAVQNTMDGHYGIAGWNPMDVRTYLSHGAGVYNSFVLFRWLFIINSVAFALFGFVLLPNLPNTPNPRAFWFNSDHAVRRRAEKRARKYKQGTLANGRGSG